MSAPAPKKENLLINLICNIAVPTLVLTKLSSDKWLGPQWGIIVALAFPLGYGIYDLVQRKKFNLFSIVGIVSVLLTGTLNQLKADSFWFAVKEASIPTLFGIAVLVSMRTKRPLVRELLWNDQVIDTARVDAALAENGQQGELDRLLRNASFGLALSFLLSAILNFGLARYLLKSPPGTVEFNAELGKMNGLSWPVIVLPTMVVTMIVFWRLMSGLTRLTGLQFEEIFHGAAEKKKA
ncbi:MAG: VC0807 family protein [Verrucomicrobiota bacterium]